MIEQKGWIMRFSAVRRLLMFALVPVILAVASFGQIAISVTIGPPLLPVYEQPLCPGDGYIWTPGYWAWGPYGYYWVPGTWVLAPEVGYLWTPPWWGWNGAAFIFHEGYWGPRVGFYGGIAYGFGYFGHGYDGGRWEGDRFFYNRSVTNVNVTNIHNVYNTTIINNTTVNHISYNGGAGGIDARATREEEDAGRYRHLSATTAQTQHAENARTNPELRASVNQGRPPVAATPRPGAFRDRAVVPAREAGGPYRAEAEHGGNPSVPRPGNNVPHPPSAVHARDLPPYERPQRPNTGNPEWDKKYQKQQDKLYTKQTQERERLQQKQEQDHARLTGQKANEGRMQQLEQRHQQQTQQMEQRHAQQTAHLQTKQQVAGRNKSSGRN